MKLRTKFSLLSALLVTLSILGVSIFLLIVEKRHLLSEMEKSKNDTMRSLIKVSEESLITRNRILILNYMKEMKKVRGVVYAKLIDTDKKILAHTETNLIGETDSTPETSKAISASEILIQSYISSSREEISDISSPVLVKGKKQGVAQIGFSQTVLNNIVKTSLAKTRNRIFGVAFVVLIIGILGATILAAIMTSPIKRMAHGADLIGQGKLDTKIEVVSKDELGDLAKDLNIMAEKLKELDEMKQDFVSSITHEFRSPLNAMGIHFDLFFKGQLGNITEEQKESLTILKNNAARLGRFIDDLLDIAKIERGKMEINPESFDVLSAADEVFQLMKVQAEKKGIELKLDIPKDLPKVFADPGRTSQIITNLVSNAIKFTPEKGKITIKALVKEFEGLGVGELTQELKNSRTQEPQNCIRVSVSDTGMGIPKDQIEKIFSKFEQVKGVKNKIEGPKGTGLGLAIVRGLVEGQGGKIWAESEPDKGSTFYFTLPIEKT
ncbi:MAG: HAMP domain-containing histidine kinase [Elusimicrobia bacterium]|nr:HAMP domain-containing histidine kinase [Elusimicrobiota bacterium]